jgi:hypothetical protein
VIFKDLQRLVIGQSESGLSEEYNQLLQGHRDKEFWIWGSVDHKQKYRVHKGACCFNHTIGLPRKDGVEKLMFDYE